MEDHERRLRWTLTVGIVVGMARPPRPVHEGLYHVATGSTRPDPFFRDNVDRRSFLAELETMLELEDVVCVFVCLLRTHYHAIFDAAEGALPQAMQRLNWHYARATNRRHGRRGHAVGGRYMGKPILDDAYLLEVYRYVAWNPVEAGEATRPQDARWSSYATTVGLRGGYEFVDASRVVGCFGRPRSAALERLRGFVEAPSAARASEPSPPHAARLVA